MSRMLSTTCFLTQDVAFVMLLLWISPAAENTQTRNLSCYQQEQCLLALCGPAASAKQKQDLLNFAFMLLAGYMRLICVQKTKTKLIALAYMLLDRNVLLSCFRNTPARFIEFCLLISNMMSWKIVRMCVYFTLFAILQYLWKTWYNSKLMQEYKRFFDSRQINWPIILIHFIKEYENYNHIII